MTTQELKNKASSYDAWEYWAERPFGAFILSMFEKGNTRDYMKNLGIHADWPAMIFERGGFYKSLKVLDRFSKKLDVYMKTGKSILEVSASCEKFLVEKKRIIKKLLGQPLSPLEKLKILEPIFSQIISYVWLAHGMEVVYNKKLRQEVPKYMKGDLDKNIGDLCFPIKKNAHSLLEEGLVSGKPLETLVEKYAWIKVRDGFSQGFTIRELSLEQKRLKKEKKKPATYTRVSIPKPLKKLVLQAQELVYFRTLRSDVLYELMYLARPILKDVAKLYHIPFAQLRDYSIHDLLAGKPKKYPSFVSAVSIGKHFAFFAKPILPETVSKVQEVKGSIAYAGKVTGIAKIVRVAHEIEKVKPGDILVAPMTFPSFIIGMKRAAAFVTDEGGITCHAAIVAREMKKPCVIGTKLATKIFKDGDLVEVNANTGLVKKI